MKYWIMCLSPSRKLFPSKDQKDPKYPLYHIAQSNYKLGGNLKVLSLTFWIWKFLVNGTDIPNEDRAKIVW